MLRGTFGKVLQVQKKDTKEIFAVKVLEKKFIVNKDQVPTRHALLFAAALVASLDWSLLGSIR